MIEKTEKRKTAPSISADSVELTVSVSAKVNLGSYSSATVSISRTIRLHDGVQAGSREDLQAGSHLQDLLAKELDFALGSVADTTQPHIVKE